MLGRNRMKRNAWAQQCPTAVGKPTVFTTGACGREALAEHATSISFKRLGTLTFLYAASKVISAFQFLVAQGK